jgi:hypothetical protein
MHNVTFEFQIPGREATLFTTDVSRTLGVSKTLSVYPGQRGGEQERTIRKRLEE